MKIAKFIVLARRPKTGRITHLQVTDNIRPAASLSALEVAQFIEDGHTFHVKDASGAEVVWGFLLKRMAR